MQYTFHKTALATGVAVALGITASPAFAQSDEPMEEIITTGIRGSLMQSMDMKRSSDGVVDAISAEDMGDFPDTNLAESLQRITGVSIDRERGEGARVTVRGFGPQFNLVTLNGRQMPTTGDNRNFDFGDLASEAVSAVEIYKTGRADIPTGGIGSTINIRTTKPLEAPGLKISAGASGVYDQSRTQRLSTGWTGEISGIISNTFADDTIGVSLTVVRQERESGGANATVGGWRSFDGAKHISWGAAPGVCDSPDAPADITPYVGQEEWGGLPIPCFAWEGPASDNLNRPEPGEIYSVPQTIGYRLEDYDRVRTNGQLTFQFRPIDTVTATLDYTFADLELDRTFNDMSAWFNFGGQQTVWPQDGNNLTPSTYSELSTASDFSMGAGEDAFKNEDRSLGLNLMWDVGDRLTVEFDYHDSKATNQPNSQWGSTALLSMAAYTRDVTTGYFEGQELPILELGLSSPLSPDDMQITGSTFQIDQSEMGIDQARLSGSFEFDAAFVESIDFGVQLTDVDYDSQFSNVQRDSWSAQTPIGALSDLLTPASMAGAFDQIDGAGDPRRQLDYFLWDMSQMIGRAEDLIASGDMPIFTPGNGDLGPCGTALCPSTNWSTNRNTKEETQALYVQVNAATEWGDFPVDLRLGLRYEQTDVTSQAEVPAYSSIVWVGGNELVPQTSGSSTFTTLTGDYDYLLPNFDVAIDFSDELVARFSYSKTLTRPNYVDIQGGVTIDSPIRIDSATGSRGNPALLPFESDNIDLSVEYYYGDASYLSVGYFRKDVKNFIGRDEVAEAVFDLPNPGLGPLADEARAAGAVTPGEIRDWILVNRPDAEGVDVGADTITGVEGRDPAAVFDLSIPVNIEQATVDGWELNVQHDFWETGFGVIVNATFVDGDVGYDNNTLGAQFALSGLSDSANFIGYYENDMMGVRLAYNWRDTFWAGNGQANVGGGQPTYTDAYGQWDLNASYWATDSLQVFLDVINLTDETAYVFGRQSDQPLFAVQQGTRYNIGVRYKF